MEGAVTVMASPTPDPPIHPHRAARHASPPSGWAGENPGGPVTPRRPAQEPRGAATPRWWPDASPDAGRYGSPADGSYQPTPPADAGYAAPQRQGGYGPPTPPTDHGTAADGSWYEGQATQQYTHIPDSEPSPFDLAMPDLRNKTVNELIGINWNHANEAWQRRRRDPLNQHVLVFFFAEPPTGRPPRCELRTAARLFLAADGQRLALLLYEMVGVARDHLAAGRDPRTHIFSWHNPTSRHARYVGLGVSSLDTPAASWPQVQQSAGSEIDVPGRCYARLIDGSMLLVDRLAKTDFGMSNVLTSDSIRDVSGVPERSWGYARDLAQSEAYGSENRATWHWLTQLNDVFLAR